MNNTMMDDMNTLTNHKSGIKFVIFSDSKGGLYLGLCNSFGHVKQLLSFIDYSEGVLLDACVELKKGNDISGYGDIVPTNDYRKNNYTVIGDEAGLYYEFMDSSAIDEFYVDGYESKIKFIWGNIL